VGYTASTLHSSDSQKRGRQAFPRIPRHVSTTPRPDATPVERGLALALEDYRSRVLRTTQRDQTHTHVRL